jgi:hypothetical protein
MKAFFSPHGSNETGTLKICDVNQYVIMDVLRGPISEQFMQ